MTFRPLMLIMLCVCVCVCACVCTVAVRCWDFDEKMMLIVFTSSMFFSLTQAPCLLDMDRHGAVN